MKHLATVFWLVMLLVCFAVMLEGCSHSDVIKQPPVKVVDTACIWAKPIMVSRQDKFTPGTARQILQYDLTARKNCPNAK
jgi:hypothetical protein